MQAYKTQSYSDISEDDYDEEIDYLNLQNYGFGNFKKIYNKYETAARATAPHTSRWKGLSQNQVFKDKSVERIR